MPAPIPTTPDVILRAILTRMGQISGWVKDQAFLYQEDDPPYDVKGDFWAFIQFQPQGQDEGRFLAAGRVDSTMGAEVHVIVRSRSALDEAHSDFVRLTDASLGHIAYASAVVNALNGFQPNDANDPTGNTGNWLLQIPMRLLPNGWGTPKPTKHDREWLETRLRFGILFTMNLDQTYQ